MSSSAGRVLIIPKGEYNNATQYQMLDAVRYNGSLYIAKQTTIGHVPADGEYWMLSAVGASDIHWGDITGSIANQSDLINALDAKQNVLTFDSTPTASSNNPVTSTGIKTALDTKQNTLTFDTTPTSGSTNPVTSEGILTAVNATASNLATIESSTTASQAYSTGDYLVLNGQLYKVTADVVSGETLVIGTNIEATTAGTELTALNNGLNPQIYEGAWISGGTSSIGARLTDILTLPKGTYLVTLTIPYVESGSPIVSLRIGSSTETPDRFMTRVYGTIVKIIELTEETQIYGQSHGSTSVSYSYFARGGIQAVRL